MRFMIIVKATKDSEVGVMPDEKLIETMVAFHEELKKAGALVDASGLQPSSKGWRIKYSGDKRALTDGPFAETKDLIAGYTLIEVSSREEAIQWTKRFPNPAGDGKEGEIEVRQLFALEDFGPSQAIDRFRELGVGTKKVGATEFTTPSDRELVAVRVVDAPRSLVWEAWTNPRHVPGWMLGPGDWSMPVCEIDLRPGGTWHFGWRGPDGTEMEMWGEYQEVAAPERLINTERWGGDWPETVNTLVLTEDQGKTTMTCTLLYPSKEARDRAIGTGMLEGWSASYDRLDEYLPTMAKK